MLRSERKTVALMSLKKGSSLEKILNIIATLLVMLAIQGAYKWGDEKVRLRYLIHQSCGKSTTQINI